MAPQSAPSGARHARYEVHQPALLRLQGQAEDSPDLHQVTVVDFSFTGVRIASHVTLADQAEVGLRLLCNGKAQSEIALQPRWSNPLEAGGFHHGMQFVEEGALLPFLGLDKTEYSNRMEAGPAAQAEPGVLQVHAGTRIGRIEYLRCIVKGDLEVDQGLSHAKVTVEGQLDVVGGGVVGGETNASLRMDLNGVGDIDKTPTRLCLAFLSDEITDVHRRAVLHLSRDEADVFDCKQRIESFNGEDGLPSHEDREEVMALMFEMQAKEASVEQLKEKIGLLEGLIARKTRAELSVREMIHPGVRIELHNKPECFESTQPISGPFFIHADEGGRLLFAAEGGQDLPLDQCGAFRRCA